MKSDEGKKIAQSLNPELFLFSSHQVVKTQT